MIIELQFKELADLFWEMLGELPKDSQRKFAGKVKVARIGYKMHHSTNEYSDIAVLYNNNGTVNLPLTNQKN